MIDVAIGDILDTPYGELKVVDIERRWDGDTAYIECRVTDD